MSNQANLDDTLNHEADRFLDDLRLDGQLAFAFYNRMVNHVDPETLAEELDSWLSQTLQDKAVYATDAEHLRARIEERMAGDVGMWNGYFRLASDSAATAHLLVRAPTEDSPASVTLNQVPLDGFTFSNRVLTWDVPAGSAGATSGKLMFKSFVDPDVTSPAGPDSYRGPFCSGSVVLPEGGGSLQVKGKVGVFSAEALLGDYASTDRVDYWLGTYNVFASDLDKGSTQPAKTLELRPSADGKSVDVFYDGAAVQQFTYHAGVLRWPGRVQNQPVNATDVALKFTEAPNGNKLLGGSVVPAGQSEVLDAFGPQTRRPAGDRSTVQILTTSLPSARVGDPYVAAFDASGGDESTYQWTLSGLPPGLEDKGEGAFGGTPTEPGVALVKASVTARRNDGIGTTATKRLQLTVADKSNAINPDIAEARGWLAPLLAALAGALAGFLLTKMGRKDEQEKQEEGPGEDEEPQERAEDARKADDLAQLVRAELPRDPQAMARSMQNDAASKKIALEQLARKREALEQQRDKLEARLESAREFQKSTESELEERRAEWESRPELLDDILRVQQEANQGLEEAEEQKRRNDRDIADADAAMDQLDPKGKAEMFPD